MEEVLSVNSLSIEPETSQIEDKVQLAIELSREAELTWTLTYVIDSAGSKKNIELSKFTDKSDSLTI